jgi:hypothetical protein
VLFEAEVFIDVDSKELEAGFTGFRGNSFDWRD